MVVEAMSNTADLEDAGEELIRSFSGLAEADLDQPGVVGEWSIRDCLAHILAWHFWGGSTVAALVRGESPPAPTEESMNQDAANKYRSLSGPDIQRELRRAHQTLVDQVAAMTDEERIETVFKFAERMISANDFVDGFIEHDLEHAAQIRAWRKAQGL